MIRRPDLTAEFWESTLAVWMEFESRFEGTKFPEARISQSKLADKLEYSRATIQECLDWLRANNLLFLTDRSQGQANRYKVNWDFTYKRLHHPDEEDPCDCSVRPRHHGGGAGKRRRNLSTSRYTYCKKAIRTLTEEGVDPELAGQVVGRLVWTEEIPLEVLKRLPRRLAGAGEEFLRKLSHSPIQNRYYRPAYSWLIFKVRSYVASIRRIVRGIQRSRARKAEPTADGIPEHCKKKIEAVLDTEGSDSSTSTSTVSAPVASPDRSDRSLAEDKTDSIQKLRSAGFDV